jgi:hypothetical protein
MHKPTYTTLEIFILYFPHSTQSLRAKYKWAYFRTTIWGYFCSHIFCKSFSTILYFCWVIVHLKSNYLGWYTAWLFLSLYFCFCWVIVLSKSKYLAPYTAWLFVPIFLFSWQIYRRRIPYDVFFYFIYVQKKGKTRVLYIKGDSYILLNSYTFKFILIIKLVSRWQHCYFA